MALPWWACSFDYYIGFIQGRVIIFDPEFPCKGEKSWAPKIWFRPKANSSDNSWILPWIIFKNERDPTKPIFPNAPPLRLPMMNFEYAPRIMKTIWPTPLSLNQREALYVRKPTVSIATRGKKRFTYRGHRFFWFHTRILILIRPTILYWTITNCPIKKYRMQGTFAPWNM